MDRYQASVQLDDKFIIDSGVETEGHLKHVGRGPQGTGLKNT